MKDKNLQKNKACPAKLKRSRGFVILFAVVLSAIILSITMGVANITIKEAKFSTSAKDTNYAFFAADTGIECALVNDKTPTSFPLPGAITPFTIDCKSDTPTLDGGGNVDDRTYTFHVSGLGDGKNCAEVTVRKYKSGTDTLTDVVSKGYNLGGDNNSCTSANLDRIEREIKVNY